MGHDLEIIRRELDSLQASVFGKKEYALGQECGSSFLNPPYESYHQPSFQTFEPSFPPYTPYHEPPPPSYNPYSDPYFEPQPSFSPYDYPLPPQYEPYQQPSSSSYSLPFDPPFTPYDYPYQSTFHQPQPPLEPFPPLHSTTPQPSDLDIPLPSNDLDVLTSALTRKYDALKEKYLVLLLNQGTPGNSKEMADIDEFFKAYYDHMLWVNTEGENGNPWPTDLPEKEQGVQAQESIATSHVEIFQPPMPPPKITLQGAEVQQVHYQLPEESPHILGNIAPLLEEIIPPLDTDISVEASFEMSDSEVDEEIEIESPHMFETVNAHLNASSGTLVGNVTCSSTTSLCDENASFPGATHDDKIKLNEHFPYSCDDEVICVKSDKLDILEEDPIRNDSIIMNDKTVNANESFQQILSCDLPPDLELSNVQDNNLTEFSSSSTLSSPTSSDCKGDVLCFNNCQLDFTLSTLQAQEGFKNVTVCLVPTDGNPIDFLGCDSYLESFAPKISLLYSRSLHVCILGLGTAVSPMFVLQNHTRQGYDHKPYILEPLPIDPEPPPRTSIVGEAVMKKCMFLIRDENFSYKSLRRFKWKVVSFLTCLLLTFI